MRKFAVGVACVTLVAPVGAQTAWDDGLVAGLIEDLRDDDEMWNASQAMTSLTELERPPIEELHAALESDDRQQRQLACDLLWRMYDPRGDRNHWNTRRNPSAWTYYSQGALTERMIAVTIEGLADDDTPYAPRGEGNLMLVNAANGFFRLTAHAGEAREQLLEGLESEDRQQRFLCALALAAGGVSSATDAALPILLPHLRDNDIAEDAKWCAFAIYQLGVDALPALRTTLETSDDRQQRDTIRLIITHLDGPPATIEQAEERRGLNSIATSVHDPVLTGPGNRSMYWLSGLSR